MIILYNRNHDRTSYWQFFCLLFPILLSVKFWDFEWLNNLTKSNALTFYFSFTFLYIPFSAFQTGKTLSLDIYSNKDFKYVKFIPAKGDFPDSTKYKLLGFLGSKTFISTVDNKKVTIVDQSSFDAIEIEKKQ